MKAISLYTILTLLAIVTISKAAKPIPVDFYVVADNLGTIRASPYDFDRMIFEFIHAMNETSEDYDVRIGIGTYHDNYDPEFEHLLSLIDILGYLDGHYNFNSAIAAEGTGLPANITALQYTYDKDVVEWDEDGVKFVIWVGDMSNLGLPMSAIDEYIKKLQKAGIHIIAINTENVPVDGLTNYIVEETRGMMFMSPNEDFNWAEVVDSIIDAYYHDLLKNPCEYGFKAVIAMGSVVSCEPDESLIAIESAMAPDSFPLGSLMEWEDHYYSSKGHRDYEDDVVEALDKLD